MPHKLYEAGPFFFVCAIANFVCCGNEGDPPLSPLASDYYRVETSYQGGKRERVPYWVCFALRARWCGLSFWFGLNGSLLFSFFTIIALPHKLYDAGPFFFVQVFFLAIELFKLVAMYNIAFLAIVAFIQL